MLLLLSLLLLQFASCLYSHWLIAAAVMPELTRSAARGYTKRSIFKRLTKMKPICFNCYTKLILC